MRLTCTWSHRRAVVCARRPAAGATVQVTAAEDRPRIASHQWVTVRAPGLFHYCRGLSLTEVIVVHSLLGSFSVLASFLFVTNHVVARESRRVKILAFSANSVNRHLAESLSLGSRDSRGCPSLRVILFAKEISEIARGPVCRCGIG